MLFCNLYIFYTNDLLYFASFYNDIAAINVRVFKNQKNY